MTTAALTFLSDAPEDLVPEGEQTPPKSRIQIAKVGTFKHPRYGRFTITRAVFDAFVRNFQDVSGGELPMDFDHAPEFGGKTKACGWIRRLIPDGDKLFADVEWTWLGAWAIRDREYRYISPTWQLNYTDESGTRRGPTLIAAALTNRPFFERMAVVSLTETYSRAGDQFAIDEDAEPVPAPSDSPAPMDLKTFATAIGLKEDASEEDVLTAAKAAAEKPGTGDVAKALGLDEDTDPAAVVTAAKALADKTPDPDPDPDDEKVTLSKDTVADLTAKANAGAHAAEQLAEQTFTATFAKAVDEGRVAPKMEDTFKALYKDAPEHTIATLDGLEPIVNVTPKGERGDDADTPEGYDKESYKLHREVEKYMADHDDVDYTVAFDRVVEARERAEAA